MKLVNVVRRMNIEHGHLAREMQRPSADLLLPSTGKRVNGTSRARYENDDDRQTKATTTRHRHDGDGYLHHITTKRIDYNGMTLLM